MKFADGFWLNQRGYEVNYANQAFEIEEIENGFLVVATPFVVYNRAMMLGSANLEIAYTSTQENCVKVSITHHKGHVDNGPHFVLEDKGFKPQVTVTDKEAVLVTGDTKLVVSKENWSFTYYYKDKKLTSGGWRSTRCQHGILPIPVPAVANIVSANHLYLKMTEVEGELVTPTGAAIVAAVKTKDKLPETFEIQKIGIGAGKRQYECPGILRAMIISQSAEIDEEKAQTEEFKNPEIGNNPKAENQETKDTIIKMETNIDDCSGEVLGFVMERLMKAGARDVHYVPVFMKKNRPAWVLNVICKEEDMETLQNIIFEETTTIGIRYSIMERTILPRETRTLPTPWGEVQVKVCTLNGKEQLYPEYESVAQLSREKEIPFAEIYRYIVLANKDKE